MRTAVAFYCKFSLKKEMQHHCFSTERAKVVFIVSLSSGKPRWSNYILCFFIHLLLWHTSQWTSSCCGGCFVGLTTRVEAIFSGMSLLLSDFLVPASPKSQLWQHQPGALVHQAGSGGVASLARQFLCPLPGDSRSVQLGVPQILFSFLGSRFLSSTYLQFANTYHPMTNKFKGGCSV